MGLLHFAAVCFPVLVGAHETLSPPEPAVSTEVANERANGYWPFKGSFKSETFKEKEIWSFNIYSHNLGNCYLVRGVTLNLIGIISLEEERCRLTQLPIFFESRKKQLLMIVAIGMHARGPEEERTASNSKDVYFSCSVE